MTLLPPGVKVHLAFGYMRVAERYSAISSTVIHLEGLSLLGILGLVDRAR
jgi:hypothetical protein